MSNFQETKYILVELENIATAQGGDICYDFMDKEFFILLPRQVKEIRMRNVSMAKVKTATRHINEALRAEFEMIIDKGLYPVGLFNPENL